MHQGEESKFCLGLRHDTLLFSVHPAASCGGVGTEEGPIRQMGKVGCDACGTGDSSNRQLLCGCSNMVPTG